MHQTPDTFTFKPIAFARSPYAPRIEAPHQPTVGAGTDAGTAADAVIEFAADFPEAALHDLAGFERIWLVFVFDRSQAVRRW